jgi:catechol 2,3-dioxygenase-like lactoylglutathione lyase family enzyme
MAENAPVFELRVALTVEDFDKALAFYRDALGLPLSDAWGAGPARGALLAAGRATIELLTPTEAERVDRAEVGRLTGAPLRLAMEVADSAGMAVQLAAAGAEQAGSVVETPWGHRNVRLTTPEGLQLTLFTDTKK